MKVNHLGTPIALLHRNLSRLAASESSWFKSSPMFATQPPVGGSKGLPMLKKDRILHRRFGPCD
jgi:hypothetical protein